MPCALTQGYVLDCRDSIGGSKEFYVIEKDNVTAITKTSGQVTAITKVTGKKFYKYAQVKNTSETEDVLTGNTENGTTFSKQTVKMALNKRQSSIRNELLLLARNRLLIIEVDQNGEAWLFGEENGMLLNSASAKSGKASGDRNGYELQFDGEEKESAPSVQASLITTLTTAG